MRLHNMLPFRRFCLGLALLSSARVANALTQTYCSSQNTGSDFSAVTNIYQSNGACSTTCRSEYAFAIVQYQSCWCSNYIPASQDDVSECDTVCPGYGFENCGNTNAGLFGYVQLDIEPSGTAGASSASASSTRRTTSSRATSTSTSSSSSPRTTSSVTPVTSIIQTTVSGEIVTRTVTSTPVAAAPNSNDDNVEVERKEGVSGGAVAGIVIGVVAGLALLALAAFLLWRRKKNAEAAELAGAGAGSKKNMTRNVSVLSKAGLLSRGAQPSMGETDDAFAANGGHSVRHSMLFGPGAEGVDPTSPLGSSHGESTSSRRTSKPMVYDQRLNPSALFSNSEANGSRISMQDTQDYSRPLGIANPDPRPSFESRMSNYHT